MPDCVYATAGWGVHDERWTAALRTLGHDPAVVSMERDGLDAEGLRERVSALTTAGAPVLAGPLHTVARHLAGLPTRVVGLSWGFDLHDLASANDLLWLPWLDGLIVDSEPTRAIALKAGMTASVITFLPWGIELEDFAVDGPRATFDGRAVLSLRAHESLYRVGDIIEAFALVAEQVPDAVLVIGHSGSLTDELRSRADGLGLASRVRFIDTVDERELAPLLRSAAVYVTASSVDGTSVTLLQAMACGTPVVASGTPGNLGWVDPGVTGRTFPTGDVPALAAALVESVTTDAPAMTAKARSLVEREADWPRNIARLDTALFGERPAQLRPGADDRAHGGQAHDVLPHLERPHLQAEPAEQAVGERGGRGEPDTQDQPGEQPAADADVLTGRPLQLDHGSQRRGLHEDADDGQPEHGSHRHGVRHAAGHVVRGPAHRPPPHGEERLGAEPQPADHEGDHARGQDGEPVDVGEWHPRILPHARTVPGMDRVAAVVPAFAPAVDDLLDLVGSLVALDLPVLVVDDGSDDAAYLADVEALGAQTLRHGTNAGIARSLNDGLAFAAAHDADWLLTVDQDTTLPDGYVAAVLAAAGPGVSGTGAGGTGVGVIGAEVIGDQAGDLTYPTRRTEGRLVTAEVFQTGSLWSVPALQIVGGFDERFGIDAVDAAACLRLREAGFAVALAEGVRLEHRFGAGRAVRLLGRDVWATGHSPARRETMVRNRLRLLPRELRQSPAQAFRSMRRVGMNVLLGVTVEDDRWAKARAAGRGLLPRRY